MQLDPIIAFKEPLGSAPVPVVISTRVRLARNLQTLSFPGWAKDEDRRKALEILREALTPLTAMKGAHSYAMIDLSELEKQILVERHLISRELCSAGVGTAVIVGADQGLSIMINEEDHLRMQLLRGGLCLKKAWKAMDAFDSAVEEVVQYAFDKNLGYLTACPTNVGTGMRASAMMHLPGLVIANQMEQVVRAVNQLGIAVRGLFGEGSDATGSIFQISNQQTLGEPEQSIIDRLDSVLQAIVEQEQNARLRLLETEPAKLLDKFGRAYGILQNSYQLCSTEAMNMLSLMRMAVDLQMLPEAERAPIDRLFIDTQPAHIQYQSPKPLTSDERDMERASILRNHFQTVAPLNFDLTTPKGPKKSA
ncbi:MAG: protein arginine kinase [Verrucomicrobia bacterium 21-51-4]|nr:MAG: protein arginine kinase [Verrucomicrobia bacterium 21-51-4]HQU08335.1 protein arginine kinase [Opitutales bacterium]